MRRFKKWLLEQFLPAWAKESVYADNKRLQAQLERQAKELRELNAYIDGMETALRSMRR